MAGWIGSRRCYFHLGLRVQVQSPGICGASSVFRPSSLSLSFHRRDFDRHGSKAFKALSHRNSDLALPNLISVHELILLLGRKGFSSRTFPEQFEGCSIGMGRTLGV